MKIKIEVFNPPFVTELTVSVSKFYIIKQENNIELCIRNISKTTVRKLSNLFKALNLLICSNEDNGWLVADNSAKNIYITEY